jgi:hypothetical protein
MNAFCVTDLACPSSLVCRWHPATWSKTLALNTTPRRSLSLSVRLSTPLVTVAAVVDLKTTLPRQAPLDPVDTLPSTRPTPPESRTCLVGPCQSQLLARLLERSSTSTRPTIRGPASALRPFLRIKQQQNATSAHQAVTIPRSLAHSRT